MDREINPAGGTLILRALALGLLLAPAARAQILISTGSTSGARLYQTNNNDWWIDPSGGRFDLRVNGGATPVMKVDSAGGVTSSSSTLTGTGTAVPFALTSSSGIHVLSGKLKLEQGAWIEYGDGTVLSSTSTISSGNGGLYVAVWVSPDTSNGTYTMNVSSGQASGGTLTFLNGTTFPSNVTVTYMTALRTHETPGSASGASNPYCSSTEPQNFASTKTITVSVGSNASTGYTATGTVLFIAWVAGSTATSTTVVSNAGSSGSAVANSTFTRITAAQSTNSATWVSVSGGTVTMTANGGRLMLNFACDLTQGSSGGVRAFGGFLVNGQYIDGESGTQGFTAAMSNTGPVNQIAGQWFHLTESSYTGSVSVVPIFMTGSGGTAIINENNTRVCQLSVQEIFGTGSNTTGAGSTTSPTRQILTSGSGTYTTPSGATQLRIRMVGGGGGGGGGSANSGSPGGNTSFNSVVANGGSGGVYGQNSFTNGGAGGTGGTGTASFRVPGNGGGSVSYGNGQSAVGSGVGGGSAFGGGTPSPNESAAGISAAANSGAGGSGAINSSISAGGGGGGGEYAELIINSPAATYSYAVGSGGNGGAAGTYAGGNGGSGLIIVDEYYGSGGAGGAGLASTQTFSGAQSFTSTATVGPTVWSSTANYSSVLKNGWTVVASTNPSNASTVCLYGLSPSYRNRVYFNFIQNTSNGTPKIQFNGDSTAGHHKWHFLYSCTTSGNSYNNSDVEMNLTNNNPVTAGSQYNGSFEVFIDQSNSNNATTNGLMSFDADQGGDGFCTWVHGGKYTGSSAVSSLCLYPSAGTYTGQIYMEAQVRGNQ